MKKQFTKHTLRVKSRHPSHDLLRKKHILLPYKTLIRFGSVTPTNVNYTVEINPIQGIKNSSNKLLMKQCFKAAGVKTAPWMPATAYSGNGKGDGGRESITGSGEFQQSLYFPIVAKSLYGSRGMGNTLLHSQKEFDTWIKGKTLSNYIFEEYKNMLLEFRIHVARGIGYFYTCRKALKKDTPQEKRWFMNDQTCVWFLEQNADYMKPNSFNDIVKDCLLAIDKVGLDIGAFDIRVQSPTDKEGKPRKYQEYILIEVNSAASMTDKTCEKYSEIIPKIVNLKLN